MERHKLVVVIPALNEALTIQRIILEVTQFGIPVVVDDGSSDDTGLIAKSCGAFVVTHEQNMGYDSALNSGFKFAAKLNPEYILTIDADFQHDPQLIKNFMDQMDGTVDVIVGVRDIQQRLGEKIFSLYFMRKFKIKDPLCGLKAYKAEVFLNYGCFDKISSVGTELLHYAAQNNLVIREINIKTKPRLDSSRFGGKFSANLKLIRALMIIIFKY